MYRSKIKAPSTSPSIWTPSKQSRMLNRRPFTEPVAAEVLRNVASSKTISGGFSDAPLSMAIRDPRLDRYYRRSKKGKLQKIVT
jgi:hypothetical protein